MFGHDYSHIKPLSHKARASIMSDGWITIWEGAIRSGKTVASTIAWLIYVTHSKENVFFMSGKTLGSLYKNVINGDFGLLALAAPHAKITRDRIGNHVIFIGNKTIYLYGAPNDSAYLSLKGLTAGGWYADEIATHPESFVVEALSRTAVSKDRHIFWTLNPTVPSHFIYRKFMDEWESKHMDGYRRFHFTLDDNLAMPLARRKELEAQYVGRYRMMYILGLRCAAEGVIYEAFSRDVIYKEMPSDIAYAEGVRYIACDYGTVNPCVFLECTFIHGTVYVMREYRWDSRKQMRQKTDDQYVQDMIEFAGSPDECESTIIVDPSASSFITALKMAGFMVIQGKNDVMPGIRRLASLFALNRVKIHESCTGLISELELYVWDEKAAQNGEEKPLKTNDHAPDALRYYVMTALNAYDLALPEDR